MTAEKFSASLGEINEKYIEESLAYVPKKKPTFRIAVLAACVCFAVLGIWRISVAFMGNQATDTYRVGNSVTVEDIGALSEIYGGEILLEKLGEVKNAELYYDEGGSASDPDDWYSLLISKTYEEQDYSMTVYCIFGEKAEDLKVSMVFTKDATEYLTVNGVDVQVARREFSLAYEYAYYAIFEYDGAVYDVRVNSNDASRVYEVLNTLLD